MSVIAVVPLRGPGGKTRLAGALAPDQRDDLVVALARHVLAVLVATPAIERVLLVTTTVDHAEEVLVPIRRAAAAPGACVDVLTQPPGAVGLNGAVGAGRDRALALGADRVVTLHADLPLLASGDLEALLTAGGPAAPAVIAPDDAGTGTNALVLGRAVAERFVYRFGQGSRGLHEQALARLGATPAIVVRPGTAHDLDTVADWVGLPSGVRDRLSAVGAPGNPS